MYVLRRFASIVLCAMVLLGLPLGAPAFADDALQPWMGGSGSTDGQAAAPTSHETTTPASAPPTSAPAASPSLTEVSARLAASQQTASSNTILVGAVAATVLLLLGFGALGFRRIRRVAAGSTVDTVDAVKDES